MMMGFLAMDCLYFAFICLCVKAHERNNEAIELVVRKMIKLRWASIAAVMLAPLVMTGCASNHLGFGGKKKSTTVAYPMSERTCLMRAMYFESNRSSRDGMIAVGTVVMNRVNSTAYPKTICGVVGQPNQFAPGVLTKPMDEPSSVASVSEAADAVLRGERDKKSKNAMFFHTAGLTFPYRNIHYVQVAGGNAFYEKRGRDGQLQVPTNDAPYDVAFAFAQERSGNVPQFTTPGRSQPVVAAPKAAPEQPAPVMVAQAGPIPVQNRAEPVRVKPAQEKYVHHEEMIIPFQTAPTPPPPSHHVVADANYSRPKSSHAAVDKTQTGSISVGYPVPSQQKMDEVGAILKQQGKIKKK